MPTGQKLFDAEIAKIKLKIKKSPSAAVTKRLVRQLRNLQQKAGNQRIGIDAKGGKKGRVAVDTGKQAHHRTSLNNAAAFFEDLDIPEKIIMGQKFAQYGLTPGDLTMNRLDMFAELHQGGIHKIERSLGLEGKQYFKPGASFKEKLAAVEAFAADQKLLASIADRMQFSAEFQTSGLTKRVESTATSELAAEYREKGTRRLKGQKADFLEYIPEQHEVATALGPQMVSSNDARLTVLEPYFDSDGVFDAKKLDADVKAGIFKLPPATQATAFKNIPEYSKGVAKLRKAAGILPLVGGAVGLSVAGSQAMAGDIEGAKVTAFETAVGEIPVIGDVFTADPVAGGTLEAASATQRAVEERRLNPTAADKFFKDPLNELEYAGKQILGGLKAVGGAMLFGF
jgi:hypothetical protein